MWPPDLSAAETFSETYCRYPDIRNLGGWWIVAMSQPSYSKAARQTVHNKILSDLLAIEIGKRLGQPVALNDCYSGKPYDRDHVTGRLFSTGPDRKPGTADDIVLEEH